MSAIAAALKHMLAAGMPHDAIVAAVEEMEATARPADPVAQRKRERDRDRMREKRAADKSRDIARVERHPATEATSSDSRATLEAPRAPVRDITPYSENNHNHTLLENRVADCDWPEGKAIRHAELICAEMASPWLDPMKSPGLVTTAGRLAAWKRDGASWEHDVLPLIRGRLMNRRSPVTTWGFFDAAIGESVAANRAALAIPEASTVVPFRSTGPPISRDEKISASWDYALEKIAADEQS